MVRDHVMRLIEQLAAMLAGFFAKRDAGLLEEARAELDAVCQQQLGLTLDFVKRSSPEAVANVLSAAGGLRQARSVLLSELLAHDAGLSTRAGRTAEASVAQLHAFCLLADSIGFLTNEEQTIYRPKLDALAESLRPLSGDPYVRGKLERMRGAKPA